MGETGKSHMMNIPYRIQLYLYSKQHAKYLNIHFRLGMNFRNRGMKICYPNLVITTLTWVNIC
jgi:hypothetical protein